MFEISQETTHKYGYKKIKKIKIWYLSQDRDKGQLFFSDIEMFGRAIKITITDDELKHRYIVNSLANQWSYFDGSYSVRDDELDSGEVIVDFMGQIFVVDHNTADLIRDYITFAIKNIDFFEQQYQEEQQKPATDINSLSGIEFENLCKQLIQSLGFEVHQTKASGDGGIDLFAFNHQPFTEGKYIVQCKRYKDSVGEPILRDLYGVVCSERANKGVLITTGYFSSNAIGFAKDKNIELIDGEKLNILLNDLGGDQLRSVDDVCRRTVNQILEEELKFDILEKMNYLQNHPREEQMRAKVIEELTGEILSDIIWIENRSERLVVMSEIHKQISLFAKYCDKKNINVRFNNLKWLLDIHTILDIQCYIFESNFYQAFQEYRQLMNRTELLIENMYEDNVELALNYWLRIAVFEITYNIIQISLLFEDEKLTDEMSNIGISYINDMQNSCSFAIKEHNGKENVVRYWSGILDAINSTNEFRGYFVINEYLIRIANEATYENSDPNYLPDWRPAWVIDDSLIFGKDDEFFPVPYNKEKEYFRIDGLSKVISKSKLLM